MTFKPDVLTAAVVDQHIEAARQEFMRQWAVDGMPADKRRLAEAAWIAARDAVISTWQIHGTHR